MARIGWRGFKTQVHYVVLPTVDDACYVICDAAVSRESEARSSRTRSHSSRSLKDQHFLVKFVCVCSRSVRRKLWPKLWPGVSLAMWTAVERAGTCPGCRSLTLM